MTVLTLHGSSATIPFEEQGGLFQTDYTGWLCVSVKPASIDEVAEHVLAPPTETWRFQRYVAPGIRWAMRRIA